MGKERSSITSCEWRKSLFSFFKMEREFFSFLCACTYFIQHYLLQILFNMVSGICNKIRTLVVWDQFWVFYFIRLFCLDGSAFLEVRKKVIPSVVHFCSRFYRNYVVLYRLQWRFDSVSSHYVTNAIVILKSVFWCYCT